MAPKREWLQNWLQIREKLTAHVDFAAYFRRGEIHGYPVEVLRVGLCSVPSGKLIVRSPFGSLQSRREKPYFVPAPVGEYPLELSVVTTTDAKPIYAAARLLFNYNPAVHYEQALCGGEDLEGFDSGYYGFWAQDGWGCVCDERTHQAFCDFADRWREKKPQGDLNEDYFEPLLLANAKTYPQKQPQEGGWLNWTVPGSRQRAILFRTGWGEGNYPAFWGTDEEGRICQLVIWFLDLEHQQQDAPTPLDEDLLQLQDELVWDGSQYQGRIHLREWEGYFCKEDFYPLLVRVGSCTDLEVVERCRNFLEQQYQLLDVMMTALLDRYPLMQLSYGHLMSDNAPEMPNILDKNDFARLIYPERILLDLESGQVRAAFRCSWDPKDGLGIAVRGEEVLQIDTAEMVPTWEPFVPGESEHNESDNPLEQAEGRTEKTE